MVYLQFRNNNGELLYAGSIEWNDYDKVYHGQILDIGDLITYEGATPEECEEDFNRACEFYIDCLKSAEDFYDELHKNYKPKLWARIQIWFYHRWYYFYEKIHKMRYYHQRKKQGFGDSDAYDIPDWFIRTMNDILRKYEDYNQGVPQGIETLEEYNNIIREMRQCLRKMKKVIDAGICSSYDEALAVKERFFELFSEYFFDLWV